MWFHLQIGSLKSLGLTKRGAFISLCSEAGLCEAGSAAGRALCRCDGVFTVPNATSGPFQQPERELSADRSLNTPRNRLMTPASHRPAVPEPPGSSRARVINAPCGGKSWRWPCQSRFAFLACLAPLTLQLLARRKPSAGKKKKKSRAQPEIRAPRSVFGSGGVGELCQKVLVTVGVRCEEAELSPARTRRYARGLKGLRLLNAEGEALGFVPVVVRGWFFSLFSSLKQILQLIKTFSPSKLPPRDSSSFF